MRIKAYASRILTALTALSAFHPGAYAADYAVGFGVGVQGSRDDNFLMRSTDPTAQTGIVVSPSIFLSAGSETTQFTLDTTYDLRRYTDSAFNSDDLRLMASGAKQFEHSYIALNMGLVQESTITSELLDSGRFGNSAQPTEEYTISPVWQWTLNEKNQIAANSKYTIRDYHTAGYLGYDNWDNSVDYTYALTERWRLDAVALYSRFKSDIAQVDVPATDTYILIFGIPLPIYQGQLGQLGYSSENTSVGGQIGASYVINEANSLRVVVGRSRNTTSYPLHDPEGICANNFRRGFSPLCSLQSEDTMITNMALDWTWKSERQQTVVGITKSPQPSSNGILLDAIRLNVDWSYSMTERDRFSLGIQGTRNESLAKNGVGQLAAISHRYYSSATAGYRRQLSESWYIDASYGYRYEDYKDLNSTAASNVVVLGVSYRPVAHHWSR